MAVLEQKEKTKPAVENVEQPDEYEQLMSTLRSGKEKQNRELERRRKRAAVFSAIGDGLASLSNLFFASKGAPSMYDGKSTLSDASRARYDELQGKNDADYRDLVAERVQALQRRRAERRAQQEAAYRQRHSDREFALNQQNFDLKKQLADDEKKRKDAEEKRKDAEEKRKDALNESQIRKNDARAKYYNNGGHRGGGSGLQNYITETQYVRDKDGKLVRQVKSRVVSGTNKTNGTEKSEKVEGRFNKIFNTQGEGGW